METDADRPAPRHQHPLYMPWARGRSDGTFCQRWADDLAAFLADVGDRPAGLRLGRPDASAGYRCGSPECPECGPAGHAANWRWMTAAEVRAVTGQRYEYGGRSLTVPEWAEATGIPYRVLNYRLQSGWEVERALTTPAKKMPPLPPWPSAGGGAGLTPRNG